MSDGHSDALVFFGATGDLAYKKIFPALQAMVKRGHLDVPVIGVGNASTSSGNVAELVHSYLGSVDSNDPMASPLQGRLSGLPPIRIHVGDDEVLLDDSRRYVERAIAAGADALFDVTGMPHGFQEHRLEEGQRHSAEMPASPPSMRWATATTQPSPTPRAASPAHDMAIRRAVAAGPNQSPGFGMPRTATRWGAHRKARSSRSDPVRPRRRLRHRTGVGAGQRSRARIVSSNRHRVGCQGLQRVVLAPPSSRFFLVPRHPIDRVE
jgi:hypothetical protein